MMKRVFYEWNGNGNENVFGGRRTSVVPLVIQAFDWDHGVYLGATSASEPTAAALDVKSKIRSYV